MSLWKASLSTSAMALGERRGGTLGGLLVDLWRRPWMSVGRDQLLDEYRAAARLPVAGLAGLSAARLRRLLWRCFLDVPAYRDRWRGRLVPARLDDASDLSILDGLPMPAPDERAARPSAFVAAGAATVDVARWTAGAAVVVDADALARREAVRRRAEDGAEPMSVWGAEAGLAPRRLTDGEIAALWRQARRVLSLPGGSAEELLATADRRRRVQVVIARGGLGGAARLAAALGAELRHFVVAPEVGLLAATCASGRLHVPSDHLLIEIVDDAGVPLPAGASGAVCVTDLGNHAAPYVRQRLPERGRLGLPCSCGQPFPVLELEGS